MSVRQMIARLRANGHAIATGNVSLRSIHSQFRPVQPGSVRSMLSAISAPSRLQFRLRYFAEHESTDGGLQGGSDEVYVSAIGTDSSIVHVGQDGKPAVNEQDLQRAPPVGDASADSVRNAWRSNPHVLLEFNLQRPGDWPRTYTATLLLVEGDNASAREDFDKLHEEVGATVKTAVVTAAVGASAAAGAAIGAAVGSVIPGLGTVVGAAVGTLGALSAAAYDAIVDGIRDGLANEVFTPRALTLTVADPARLAQQAETGRERTERFDEHGAVYDLVYDWQVIN